MCGVPYHAAEGYIARLIQKGYRVAICDQMEDPRFAKKLVKREITRDRHAGHRDRAALLRSRENNYLAAVSVQGRTAPGSAHVDVSTGEFRATEVEAAEAGGRRSSSWARARCWSPDSARDSAPQGRWVAARRVEAWVFSCRLRRAHSARALQAAVAGRLRAGRQAAGGRRRRRPPALPAGNAEERRSITWTGPRFYDRAGAMVLDAVTVRNLELVEPCFRRIWTAARTPRCSACSTRRRPAWAARLLRRGCCGRRWTGRRSRRGWTRSEWLQARRSCARELRKTLGGMLDLERLLAKVTLGTAGPRDLLALGRSLAKVPAAQGAAGGRGSRRGCGRCTSGLDEVPEVRDRILAAIADEPPVNLADGGTDPRRLSTPSWTSCATSGAERPADHRGDRGAGAGAHRHRVAEGAVQQRLRLLHRDLQGQPAPGAGRLRAQADAGQRRALHHAGAEGTGSARCWTPRRRSWRSSATSSPRCGSSRRRRRSASARRRRRWRRSTSPRRWRRWRRRTAMRGRASPTTAR